MSEENRIKKNPRVVAHELAQDGGVLLHLESGSYHRLNPIGWQIWDLIDDERTSGKILTELGARLDDAPPSFEEDVRRFLDGLRERDLIG
jgi:Coenzyme PQQ synthesis protein D (PqqD)